MKLEIYINKNADMAISKWMSVIEKTDKILQANISYHSILKYMNLSDDDGKSAPSVQK